MTTFTAESLAHVPIYREGATDAESARVAEGDAVNFHLRAYAKMGPVYRTMLDRGMSLVFAGMETNDFIWRNTQLWTYQNLLGVFRDELGEDHVTAIDGAHHKQKRGILKPAFDQAPAMRYLPAYNSLFHTAMQEAAQMEKVDLVAFWGKKICLTQSQTVAQTTIPEDVIVQMIEWEKILVNGIRLFGEERRAYYHQSRYLELKALVMKVLGAMLDERLADPGKYDDNFAMVMQARAAEEGENLNREHLLSDLYLVLLAGVGLTSQLLNSALLLILKNRAWLAEIRQELDAWDGVDIMALSKMSKLKATIMEVQRLYTTAMLNFREAAQDFEFGGYAFPAGTVLVHMQILCHYMEEYYPEPFQFRPQRFVENGQFVPKTNGFFGGGTHVCLGRNHSLVQSPIAVAQMLKYYDIEVVEEIGASGGKLEFGSYLQQLWVRVQPRKA
jgi:cytochrome P450